MSKTRDVIDSAFVALEHRAEENGLEAFGLFRKAFDAALDSEREHRRVGAGLGRYKASAVTCARYFVVKWFLDPGVVIDARSAAGLRLDCLYASALRQVLVGALAPAAQAGLMRELEAVASIDYAGHLATV